MAYTPPAGNAVTLSLGRAYEPPAGGVVALDLNPLPGIRPGLYLVVGEAYGSATRLRPEWAAPAGAPPKRRIERAPGWADAVPQRGETRDGWADSGRVRTEAAAPWAAPSAALRRETDADWIDPARRRAEDGLPWGAGQRLGAEGAAVYHAPPRRELTRALAWEAAARLSLERGAAFLSPDRQRRTYTLPWDQSRRVRWEEPWLQEGEALWTWRRLGRPGAPTYSPPPGHAVPLPLQCPLLDWPGYAVWLFLREQACPPAAVRRRTWFVMNSVSVVRLPDLAPVPALSVSLTTDADSWAWGLTLTLPDREALALVSPVAGEPVAVQVTINGHVWTALVESFAERRQFGNTGFTVTGRSRSALLAAPYAAAESRIETQARTAAQLAEAALTDTGWSLDWSRAVDWLVPAGAFSYQGATPIDVVGTVAAAAGARVFSDPADAVLRVLPRYPVSPWEWLAAEPDVVVTDNLLRALSLQWAERPEWNGVYVSGQTQGVLVRVTRAGSAGDLMASMVVDPLCTAVEAGRERGRNVLAAGGRQASVTVELPLLATPAPPGLLTPGQLAEVDDGVSTWRGLVTGTTVEASRPWVRQTVELVRHYY